VTLSQSNGTAPRVTPVKPEELLQVEAFAG
jgi:hypothetical protein